MFMSEIHDFQTPKITIFGPKLAFLGAVVVQSSSNLVYGHDDAYFRWHHKKKENCEKKAKLCRKSEFFPKTPLTWNDSKE